MKYQTVGSFKSSYQFRAYLERMQIDLSFDDELDANRYLGQPYRRRNGFTIGNRFAVLPMEGWDGTTDGRPGPDTIRRWRRFGMSGAKLVWGGEAVAVSHDGRANPNQLLINDKNASSIAELRRELIYSHKERYENVEDLYVGLQLTHSGRFARPSNKPEPKILYHHPVLDKKFNIDSESALLSDAEIREIIDDFIKAAGMVRDAGFHFVDIKHCHGYLGHEFLSAFTRPGPFGGSFENRTRFLRDVIAGTRAQAPGLEIAVRLSAFDWRPFQKGINGLGEPVISEDEEYGCAFGGDRMGTGIRLDEAIRFLQLLVDLDIELVCITAGSPYYNPHIQRPALFPPSDGYLPPEDPLAGVARQIRVTAMLKVKFPTLAFVGSAYSYLQEFLPNVAQNVIRTGKADFTGLGRMMLSYPELPDDVLKGRPLQRQRICRTFSDCTTAPRGGLHSGCYPLDEHYKTSPDAQILRDLKKGKK